MKIADLENRVDILSLIEKRYKTKRVGSTLRVDPCPVCGAKEHFTVYPETNSYSSFNACCTGGSVYRYLQEVEKMDEDSAYKELLSLAGEEIKRGDTVPTPTKQAVKESPRKDYTNLMLEYYHKQTEADKEYFRSRGLSDNVINEYKLSVGMDGAIKRAFIPIWENSKVISYNARAIDDNAKPKYKKPSGASAVLNGHHLDSVSYGDVIFVTEGEFDALSLESIGYKAIGLGGSQNISKIGSKISECKTRGAIVLAAFDNDDAGSNAAEKLGCPRLDIPKEYKDPNEWLVADRSGMEKGVVKQINEKKRPDSVLNYFNQSFIEDMAEYKQFQGRKTGFENIDKVTSLYPGLYVIGGLSTLGKTTFIHQMGDQLAERGEHVVYFSLEMSKLELVTKSISRLTATRGGVKESVSSLQIRLNEIEDEKRSSIQDAIRDYSSSIAGNFSIIEGNFDTNVRTIREYTEHYGKSNGVKPVVIIDYLQIIGAEGNMVDKQRVDGIVTELKRMSRDLNITVIVISSLNRGNYLTPIDFESFKESGGIEYTADVIWGLQLQCINEDLFNSQAKIKEKRERINEAKKENPRAVELVCLKNRNGISNYRCGFLYYPHCDYFVADDGGAVNSKDARKERRTRL